MDSPLWGIIPGKASQPLGQITLPVQFGTTEHFRTDYVNFLVVDFNTSNHAILDRPALAKFKVVPHYTYLVLKMSMEKGIFSLHTNLSIAYAYEKESFMLTKATDISIHMQDCLATSQQIPPEKQQIPTMEAPRAATNSKEVKEVVLVPGDQSKIAQIRAKLNPK
jgi:hypothetical protein